MLEHKAIPEKLRSHNATTEVLIPAAGRVPEGVFVSSNIDCISMVPLAGRPVIYRQLKELAHLGFRTFRIAVGPGMESVKNFVGRLFQDLQVEFLTDEALHGVGHTVQRLLERCDSISRSALVILGDTYLQFKDVHILRSHSPFVLWDYVAESQRWCLWREDPRTGRLEFMEKQDLLHGVRAETRFAALIGAYYFPDIAVAQEAAAQAAAQAEREARRTEMSDILNIVDQVKPIQVGKWYDVGHPDRHITSHLQLLEEQGFRERNFNKLDININRQTVIKTVRHESASQEEIEKFLDEISYYACLGQLCPELLVLFPRVVSACTDWYTPHLELEFYSYPSLADLFLFGNVSEDVWLRVFQKLLHVIERFSPYQRPADAESLQAMYLGKTRRRLESLVAQLEKTTRDEYQGALYAMLIQNQAFWVKDTTDNSDTPVQNLLQVIEQYTPAIQEVIDDCTSLTIMHGDMGFSNLLVDLPTGMCKLLDPRGSWGALKGVYGDSRYDVSKLYHSVYGLYDVIVNDLFTVEVVDHHIALDIHVPARYEEIVERFGQVFFKTFEQRTILLLTALLFASMIPLHRDVPRRQLAMYLRAHQLFNEYCKS